MKQDEKTKRVRSYFPAVENVAYFNAGTCGPLPQVTAEAMQRAIAQSCEEGRGSIPKYMEHLQELEALRGDFAELVGADADEIVITQHTTEGMNHVLWGMDLQPGDQIVTSTHEHQALLASLAMLHARRGVEVIYLPFTGNPIQDLEMFEDAIHPNISLVALSHVSWVDGFAFPIEEVTNICNDEGIPILVDGAQSAGVFPFDVKDMGVDFFAAPAQKWLCGPEGLGFLYVHKDWFSRLKPTYTGIFGIREMSWFDQTSPYYVPAVGARRFQHGGLPRPLVYGMRASLQLLASDIGWKWSARRTLQLCRLLRAALEETKGVEVLTPRSAETSLLTFTWKGLKPQAVRDDLESSEIIIRDVPFDDTPRLRASVGFFNDENDIDRLLHALKRHI